MLTPCAWASMLFLARGTMPRVPRAGAHAVQHVCVTVGLGVPAEPGVYAPWGVRRVGAFLCYAGLCLHRVLGRACCFLREGLCRGCARAVQHVCVTVGLGIRQSRACTRLGPRPKCGVPVHLCKVAQRVTLANAYTARWGEHVVSGARGHAADVASWRSRRTARSRDRRTRGTAEPGVYAPWAAPEVRRAGAFV